MRLSATVRRSGGRLGLWSLRSRRSREHGRMSRFIDALIAQVLTLEVQLRASQARLAARTDAEALHDLRIALRRYR